MGQLNSAPTSLVSLGKNLLSPLLLGCSRCECIREPVSHHVEADEFAFAVRLRKQGGVGQLAYLLSPGGDLLSLCMDDGESISAVQIFAIATHGLSFWLLRVKFASMWPGLFS
jgi:hypothetical protein